ncbi:hypothetical protein FRB96_002814 [Tulasnella sp. 330]|nr:hypothetical protein FRB96_002814 [Tulasnella sp. 330]KAG8874778.1 hypothetical protein FRB97_005653 [Tulasnella sp. 331]KAG8879750.1 hypothetical protein FRB98_005550 [Tulasnella sp. 332]
MAAPKWLRLIVNWLARRRIQAAQPNASGPRRRASFPSYQAIPSQQQFRQNQQLRASTLSHHQRQFTGGGGPISGGGGSGVHPHYRPRSNSIGATTGKPSSAPLNNNAGNNTNANNTPYLYRNAQGQHVSISPNAYTTALSQYKQTATNSPFTNAQLDAYRAMGLMPVAHIAPGQTQPQYYLVPAPVSSNATGGGNGGNSMTQIPAARPVTMSMSMSQPPPIPFPSSAPAPTGQGHSQSQTQDSKAQKPKVPKRNKSSSTGGRAPPPNSPRTPLPPPPIITPMTPFAPVPTRLAPLPPLPPPPPSRRTRITAANSAPATSTPYNVNPRRVHDAYARYTAFLSATRSPRRVTFDSVPWPMVDPPKYLTSITVHAVRSFLFSPHHSVGIPARQRVEAAQALWDPAQFWARFGGLVKSEDRELIERALMFLSGTLRMLHAEAVDAESLVDDDGSE